MPVMPSIVFIEGINCRKKKPLSQVSDCRGKIYECLMLFANALCAYNFVHKLVSLSQLIFKNSESFWLIDPPFQNLEMKHHNALIGR